MYMIPSEFTNFDTKYSVFESNTIIHNTKLRTVDILDRADMQVIQHYSLNEMVEQYIDTPNTHTPNRSMDIDVVATGAQSFLVIVDERVLFPPDEDDC